jgi:histidine ammonia-lyase
VSLPTELDLETFIGLSRGTGSVELDPKARQLLEAGHRTVVSAIESGDSVYGVNTGFGPFSDRPVGPESAATLQQNLLQQLSGNIGPGLPAEASRGATLHRAAALARGHSGVRPQTVDALIALVQSGATPYIQSYGSVGASGDLVPLARLARVLTGHGALRLPQGDVREASLELLATLGVPRIELQPKEGLAIVNGTSVSLAVSALALYAAQTMLHDYLFPLAATLFLLLDESFQFLAPEVYRLKGHASALQAREALAAWLPHVDLKQSPGVPQPPYSTRSMVLWAGSVRERLNQAEETVEVELNSVDDNPLVFAEEQELLHAANFQGSYVAMAADRTAEALGTAATLAERQLNRLLHGKLNGDLPPFLAPEPVGLHSGLQGLQLTATGLAAEMRSLAAPRSTTSIATNGDNQDVVSMSANAALNALDSARKGAHLFAAYECALARALQLRSPTLGEPLSAWWGARQSLLERDFVGAPLDGVLAARAAKILPWDDDAESLRGSQ